MKIRVVYYSMYGHVHQMTEAIAEGAREVSGADVALRRVPETLSGDILKAMGAVDAQKAFAHIPICTIDELATADAIQFGRQPFR
jgi:NAD(P)H dehydrogenase (quinone)